MYLQGSGNLKIFVPEKLYIRYSYSSIVKIRRQKMLKIIGIIVAIVLILGAVSIGFGVLKLPVKTLTTQIDSASEIIDKTNDADNAIYNYEWFKTQHEQIQVMERQIKISEQEIDDHKDLYGTDANAWGYSTKDEYSRLKSIRAGQDMQYEKLVGDYNARSKMANRNIFQDKLPLHVDKILW